MSWVRITRADSIPLREGRAVKLGSEEVAIFNLGEKFLAVGNHCPHRGGPLADGIVSGDVVVCPLHAWKVCLRSGKVKQPGEQQACATSYPVKVVEGIVVVNLAGEEAAAARGAIYGLRRAYCHSVRAEKIPYPQLSGAEAARGPCRPSHSDF